MTSDASNVGDLSDAELEALAVAGAQRSRDDVGGLEAWLRHVGAGRGGPRPSLPACEAFVVYRRWAEGTGAQPLEPRAFAAAMLARFDKRRSSFPRHDGRPGYRTPEQYLLPLAAARRLRAAWRACPPTPADRAAFDFFHPPHTED